MIGIGATHRHAPFAGRSRELGILTQLLLEGFAGGLHLVRVAGESGSGRRRLLAEARHHGPDAEWVDLAPGGVEADLRRWSRTELPDLLESYPEVRPPSWALHTLSRYEPSLARWAARPALSREPLPPGDAAAVIGAAAGAILVALTARTTLVVHAGLWPAAGSDREVALLATARALRGPGAVMTAAIDRHRVTGPEPAETRTLILPPLGPAEFAALTAAWMPEETAVPFAGWLARASGGSPFAAHETVRWLEELGHLRVDDEAMRVELLVPLERLPIPLGLPAVMSMRHARLPLASRYLLWLIAEHDGRLDREEIFARYEAAEETFEEALAHLRRREFLLERSMRRPLALAGPLWEPLAAAPSRRRFPRRRPSPTAPLRPPPAPESPLSVSARAIDALAARLAAEPGALPATEIAHLWRVARPRPGPAWAGLRGRLALLAAVTRRRQGRAEHALAWTRRGQALLQADVHPTLRRDLGALALRILEAGERAEEAQRLRRALRDEALFAGHDVTAARLAAAAAEGDRRTGRVNAAADEAADAEARLVASGLLFEAELAWLTRVRALVDARDMTGALALAREGPGFAAVAPLHHVAHLALADQLESAESAEAFLREHLAEETARGRPFGLEDAPLEHRAEAGFTAAFDLAARDPGELARSKPLTLLEKRLRDAGLVTAAADLWELRLRAALESLSGEALEAGVERLASLHRRLAAPERTRRIAALLVETRAASTRAFQHAFRPALFGTTAIEEPTLTHAVRLRLFGRPELERGGAVRPAPLWPAWWGDLVTAAVAGSLLGCELSLEDARALLAAAGYASELGVDAAVDEANDILWDRSALPGGLHGDGDAIAWSWNGIGCDLRDVLRRLDDAGRLERDGRPRDATAARRDAFDLVSGPLLPGFRTDAANALRAHVDARLGEAMRAELERHPLPDATDAARWGEGLFGEARKALADALSASPWNRAGRPPSERPAGPPLAPGRSPASP